MRRVKCGRRFVRTRVGETGLECVRSGGLRHAGRPPHEGLQASCLDLPPASVALRILIGPVIAGVAVQEFVE
jgi:hypothetical protein